MIVVVGRVDSGYAVPIARRLAASGAGVELVATVPPGAGGDARLAALAAAGVGHAAVLRSPANVLEPADLELALRYLPDVRTIVLAAEVEPLASTAIAGAAWSGAALILVPRAGDAAAGRPGADPGVERRMIVLEAPETDPDEAFAGLAAALAARLDAGEPPEVAWRAVARDLALDPVSPR